jgi:hypothetical protein
MLTTLDLSLCTHVTDAALQNLDLRNIKNLDLTASSITDAGLRELNCPHLNDLVLSGADTEITDAGLNVFNFPSLTKLSIAMCAVTGRLLGLNFRNLVTLYFFYCDEVSDTSLLGVQFPNLTTLLFDECDDVTHDGLLGLTCPSLIYFYLSGYITILGINSPNPTSFVPKVFRDGDMVNFARWQTCPNLTFFYLQDSHLTLNYEQGSFPNLLHLDLSSTIAPPPFEMQGVNPEGNFPNYYVKPGHEYRPWNLN